MSCPPVFQQKKRDANTRPRKRINTSSLQVRLRSVRWYRLSLYWSRSFMIFMINRLTSLERQVTSKMILWWSYLLWFITSISIKQKKTPTPRLSSDVSVFFRVRALLPANVLWGLSSSQNSPKRGVSDGSIRKIQHFPSRVFPGYSIFMVDWWFGLVVWSPNGSPKMKGIPGFWGTVPRFESQTTWPQTTHLPLVEVQYWILEKKTWKSSVGIPTMMRFWNWNWFWEVWEVTTSLDISKRNKPYHGLKSNI